MNNVSPALDCSIGFGGGSDDMVMYVPVSTLGVDGSKYLYFYSEFGGCFASSDGFEEWAVIGVPDPATMVLLRKRK